METAKLPDGFTANYQDGILSVTDGDTELEKKMDHALVDVNVTEEHVEFKPLRDKKDIESIAKSYKSHTENLVQGLQEDYVYKMKGVYAHFPMTINKKDGQVQIENFLGERFPRTTDIMENVEVEINGEDIELSGPNKEKVAQTAARIEQLCRKGNRDPRTFQDGVYITDKGENE